MKPSSFIILILEILLVVSLLNTCVAHKEERVFLNFVHGGLDESGRHDGNVYGSVVSDEIIDFTSYRFEKPFDADYEVTLHYYDKNGNYKGTHIDKAFWGESLYARIELTKPDGEYFSDLDLVKLISSFKFYRVNVDLWTDWFGSDIPGLDLGIWPFN